MRHEILERIKAIRSKLSGKPVSAICQTLGRSRQWFYKWWSRFQQEGSAGLADGSRRPRLPSPRIDLDLEQAIVAIRRRLSRQRYATQGAPSIARELAFLGYEPVSRRTIYRVLRTHGLTVARQKFRPKPALRLYPLPTIKRSGRWQQIDFIGPRHREGSPRQLYFPVLRDLSDQAVYLELATSHSAHTVLEFLIRGWQTLGMPQRLSMDNAAELSGSLKHKRTFSRVVRLCLLLGVEPVFIPEGEACRQGSIENFNGLFDRLFYRAVRFRSLAQIRREREQLRFMANHQHPHQRLGYQTSAQVARVKGCAACRTISSCRGSSPLQPVASPSSGASEARAASPSSTRSSLSVGGFEANMSGRPSSPKPKSSRFTIMVASLRPLTTGCQQPEVFIDPPADLSTMSCH